MRGVALILAGVGLLAAGCGSSPAAANTAAVSTFSTAAGAVPLSEVEHAFVEELSDDRVGDGIDVHTLVRYGNAACTALSSGGADQQTAAAAVKSAGSLDDATAATIVRAAADHLCPTAAADATPSAGARPRTASTATTTRRPAAARRTTTVAAPPRAAERPVQAQEVVARVVAPAPEPPAAPEPTPAPEPVVHGFGPGTYEVGTGAGQIAPGTYRSPGPTRNGGICYYARLRNNDGAIDDIIANDDSEGPSIMSVGAADGYVKISGCTFA